MNENFSFTLLLLLVATAALGLTACGERQTRTGPDTLATSPDTTPRGAEAMQQRSGMRAGDVTARSTVSLLRQGVRNVASNRAVQNINAWQQKLGQQDSTNQALKEIDGNLEQLKTELLADQIDARAMGALLSELGQQTAQVAQNANGPDVQQIEELSQLLTEAGRQITTGG